MHKSARWTAVLALVLAAGLLLAFDRVVRQGVHQGVQRRAAVAAQADAKWRCAVLPAGPARADCVWAAR